MTKLEAVEQLFEVHSNVVFIISLGDHYEVYRAKEIVAAYRVALWKERMILCLAQCLEMVLVWQSIGNIKAEMKEVQVKLSSLSSQRKTHAVITEDRDSARNNVRKEMDDE